MTTPQPAVRAGAILDALAFLDTFEPGARAKVVERLPPSARDALLTTTRSSWVSIEHDRFAVDAIVNMFGVTRAIQFWRRATSRLTERPLLKNFVSGMISLLGDDPGRVIGILPKGWTLVYRDLCQPSFARVEPCKVVLRFERVAPEVQTFPNYFHSWNGTCLGMMDLARKPGVVEFVVAPERASAIATFAWV